MPEKLKILHLEDSAADAELAKETLKENGVENETTVVETKEDFERELSGNGFDIILADYHLPNYNGMEALEFAKRIAPLTPFVFVSGVMGEEFAVKGLRQGATDYVFKNALYKLPDVVKRALKEAATKKEKELAFARNEHLTIILKSIMEVNNLMAEDYTPKSLIEDVNEILTENGYQYSLIAKYNNDILENIGVSAASEIRNKFLRNIEKNDIPKCWELASKTNQTIRLEGDNEICKNCKCKLGTFIDNLTVLIRKLNYKEEFYGYLHVALYDIYASNEEEIDLFEEIANNLSFDFHSYETERQKRKAEESLKESEAKYRELVDNALAGVYKTTVDGDIIFANKAMAKMFGFESEEEFMKHKANSFYINKEQRENLMCRLKKEKNLEEFEIDIKTKKGEIRNLILSASLINGVISGMMLDITDRKKTEEALRESEEKHRMLAENSSDVIWTMDLDLNYVYCSPSVKKILGYSPNELKLLSFDKIVTASSLSVIMQIYKEEMEIEKQENKDPKRTRVIEIENIAKDGSIVWTEENISFLRNEKGKAAGFIGVSRNITDRKRAEEALHRSEERLNLAIKSAKLGLFDWKVAKDEIYLNDYWFQMLGYNPEEIPSKPDTVFNLMEPKDINFYKKINEEMLSGKIKEFKEETRFKTKGGGLRWIQIIAKAAEQDKQGKPLRIIGFNIDVHDRKLMEEELRKHRDHLEELVKERTAKLEESNREIKKLSQAVEQSPTSVVITDIKGNIIYVNKAFEETTGYSAKEVIDENPRILKSGYHDKEFYKEMWNTILSGETWRGNIKNKKKNGEIYWDRSHISPIFDDNEEIKYFAAVKEDITVRKQQEAELLKAYRKLKIAHDKLDKAHKELKDTQSQLVQSEKMAALGQLIAGIAHEINSPLGAIKSQNDSFSRDIGSLIKELLALVKSLPEDIVNLMTEMTCRAVKNSESLMAKEERKKKRELIKSFKEMELKNPMKLASIFVNIGGPEEIEDFKSILKHPKNEEILDAVNKLYSMKNGSEIIKGSVDSIIKIVFALKNYARYDDSQEPEKASLIESLETILTLYHNKMKYNVNLEKRYDFKEPILCYPDELNQVWTNILNNALHAMEFKGDLKVKVYKEGRYAVTTFIDSGKGIPKKIQKKIFEPFYTTKPLGEGTGLGLDIVKKIVDKHNGKIEIESEEGVGTTFKVMLPIKNKGE